MYGIQDNAERVVRDLLRRVYDEFGGLPLEAEDQMDDGSTLKLKIKIDRDSGSASFDFTGTSLETYGNLNAPRAITFSAIIYVLRSLVKEDIPLNQGCLSPISVILPEGTIISPSHGAATVGGNVETSQRVTDLVLKAFQAAAASQGTCNNLTFGYGGQVVDGKAVPGFGYYEVRSLPKLPTGLLLSTFQHLVSNPGWLTRAKTDHRRRSRSWSRLGRAVRRARPHDQHAHHRPGVT